MENKYIMSRKDNIMLAKRNIVDSIWKSANLEGIAVTFPETEMIFDGLVAKDMIIKDVNAIINLKKAWEFITDYADYSIDYGYICMINKIIGSDNVTPYPGYMRTTDVKMSGTEWVPEIPNEITVKEQLEEIKKIENATEQAITLMLYLMRSQIFYDGNKRTAMLAANQVMIYNGVGIISIPLEEQKNFRNELVKFYETNDMSEIKKMIYDKCIDGIDFNVKENKDLLEFERKLKEMKKLSEI